MKSKAGERFSENAKSCFRALAVYVFGGFCVCALVPKATDKKINRLASIHVIKNEREVKLFIETVHASQNTALLSDSHALLDKTDLRVYRFTEKGMDTFPLQEFDQRFGEDGHLVISHNNLYLLSKNGSEFLWSRRKFCKLSVFSNIATFDDPRIEELLNEGSEERQEEIVSELAAIYDYEQDRFNAHDFHMQNLERDFQWMGKRYLFKLTDNDIEKRLVLREGEQILIDLDINQR
ncbi:MAG: hypothetical protein P1V97_27610 [Planctomycetota bacterium]|nr:hypothetical protein [Planctomycetota bacterium]